MTNEQAALFAAIQVAKEPSQVIFLAQKYLTWLQDER